ncbi:MAG TPA: aminotransferase class V-fold PLP-dependent enzyme, partial [Mesorhizobium sp.]
MASSETAPQPGLLTQFRQSLAGTDTEAVLRAGLIGIDATVDGPFGPKKMVYADYVASGRALMQIEQFILEKVLPYYANSHTEASYCGGFITRLRREARQVVAQSCGAGGQHGVIFTGAGATAGLNRLTALLGIVDAVAAGEKPCVIIGPYEHHSNVLPWRESGAEVIEIAEGPDGGPDLEMLRSVLAQTAGRKLVVGAFSAASNITGIVTDVVAVTRLLNDASAKVVWDYAGGGPYLPIAMTPAPGVEIDAIVVSPHKFLGGPGSSGILILRHDAAVTRKPTWPGGGTVRFVSPAGHDYSESLEARE